MNNKSSVDQNGTMLDEKTVYSALKECYDPEILVNIVDLGLIYKVSISGDRVEVNMTLTTPGCGMGGYIANQVREKLLTIPGIHEAEVKIVWEPKWDESMITPEGRKMLGRDS